MIPAVVGAVLGTGFLVGSTGSGAETLAENRAAFEKKLTVLCWVNYSPTTLDPQGGDPVTEEVIEADLQALIDQGFDPARTGIATYGASPELGLDQIAAVVRRLKFAGFIQGCWDPTGREVAVVVKIARQGLADALVLGNEGLDSRYDWPTLCRAMARARTLANLPVSTSEQIEDYGFDGLTDPDLTDWVYPNCHPAIYRGFTDPKLAAEWVDRMATGLRKRCARPILIHETGWPSQGLPHHTPENQRDFWRDVRTLAERSGHSIVLFEAFDQEWKVERDHGVNIGVSWGLFTSGREPKLVVEVVRPDRDLPR